MRTGVNMFNRLFFAAIKAANDSSNAFLNEDNVLTRHTAVNG
jgi:hypothetical protein